MWQGAFQICALKIGDFTKASLRSEEYRDSDTQARYYRAPEILLGAPTYDQSGTCKTEKMARNLGVRELTRRRRRGHCAGIVGRLALSGPVVRCVHACMECGSRIMARTHVRVCVRAPAL